MLDALNRVGKAGKLNANEMLAGVALFSGTGEPTRGTGTPPEPHDPWTPQNNCLTATNKLNRKPIQQMYANKLQLLIQKGIRG